jgi:MFS-type transporter involved in bile tolerance (Atg22 family)
MTVVRCNSVIAAILVLSFSITNAQHAVAVDQSYGDRTKDALFGFLVGLVLVIFSIPALWFVEQIAVEDYLVLNRCRKAARRLQTVPIK